MSISRGQIILLLSLILSLALTALLTHFLSKFSSGGSTIRDQGPEHHKKKAATPSTGGHAFLASLAIVGYPGALMIQDPRALVAVTAGLLTGLIGLADDILKKARNDSSGLKARYKLPLQIFVGLLVSVTVCYLIDDTIVRLPFFHHSIDIGNWKILLGLFVYLAIINGVNFTDGLDSLATSTVAVASVCLAGAVWTSAAGSILAPVLLLGICIGFLPFNWHPAKIFMGDSGALALSGTLATVAIASGLEIIVLIIGLVFIIEITSVVLQVVYFRLTGGKRIFRMTPIHHAWELRGYSEPAIVIGAVTIGIFAGAIGWWSAI